MLRVCSIERRSPFYSVVMCPRWVPWLIGLIALMFATAIAVGQQRIPQDFNGDQRWDYQDLADFESVFSEGPCSTGACGSIDFNGDGATFDPADLDAFLDSWLRLPPNEIGWTPIRMGPQTKTLYFSASGSNDNDGLTMVSTMRSWDLGRVYSSLGYPSDDEIRRDDVRKDAVLAFRRGDVFPGRINLDFGGVSESRPLVITSYGDPALPPPVVRGITVGGGCRGHVLLVDLDIAPDRQPITEDGLRFQGGQRDVLIEGCVVRGWQNGISLANLDEFNVYRNVIIDQWMTPGVGHSQGIGVSQSTNGRVTANVLDQNGWAGRPDARTMYNHGGYWTATASEVTASSNLVSRSSNTGFQFRSRGQYAFDNVFVLNPANITFGHDETPTSRWPNGRASGNVVVGTVDDRSWHAGSGLGLNLCSGVEITNHMIVQLPGGPMPAIRFEPRRSVWQNLESSFDVSQVRVWPVANVDAFRTLTVTEVFDSPRVDPTLRELAEMPWEAMIEAARQGRKGSWQWR